MKRYEKFLKLLKENIETLDKELRYFAYILEKMEVLKLGDKIGKCENLDYEEHIYLHAFFSNLSLIVELLLNKVLRNLMNLEAEKMKGKLDILIWAEKKGFVENYEKLLEFLYMRNMIAYEYLEIFKDPKNYFFIKDNSSLLYKIFEKIKRYVKTKGYLK